MSHIDSLPPLRDVIERHGLAAKKALGQNFLLDLNITSKIARSSGSLEGTLVLEIGPGPGGLTRAVLAHGAAHVIAIERDSRCVPALEEIEQTYPGKLTIIEGDALTIDHAQLVEQHRSGPDQPVKVIANLPYNVATPLFTGWVGGAAWPPFWDSMTLMFQKEVAQRITANQSDKAWGRLGVLSSWRCFSDIAFDLSPQAFFPPPKVTSSVILVAPKPEPINVPIKSLEKITQAAFGQRRKMLRQSLKSIGGEEILRKADIAGTRRAEELSMEEFVLLAQATQSSAD